MEYVIISEPERVVRWIGCSKEQNKWKSKDIPWTKKAKEEWEKLNKVQ